MTEKLPYQEEQRKELIGGTVVMMSPRPSVNHNHIVFNLSLLFGNYLRGKKCTPFSDGVDLFLDTDNRFVPDFMVVCDPDKIENDGVHGAPDLVVEVLSPSTAKNDRGHKKEVYARCGTREYWIVSPDEKSIEVYRQDKGQFRFHDLYSQHPDWMLAKMSEEERAAVVTHFKCCLFDELEIAIEDIFYRTV